MSQSARKNCSGLLLTQASRDWHSTQKIDQKDRAKEVCRDGHAVSLKKGDLQVTKKLEAIQATLG